MRAIKNIHRARFVLVWALASALASCFGMWGGPVATPADLAASRDKGGAIELRWSAVDRAGRYNIYRATSETGSYEQVAVSGYVGWVDVDVEQDRPYWYKVSAVDYYGAIESALTEATDGITYQHSWEEPSVMAENAATVSKLAADGDALWAAYVTGEDIVLVRNENDPDDEDDDWKEQSRLSAVWKGTSSGDLALSGGDDPVVLFCSAGDELEARRWDDTDNEWQVLGQPTSGDYENGTALLLVDGSTVYVGWMYAGTPVVQRQVEPGKWLVVENPDFSDLGSPAPQLRTFHLVVYGGDLAMAVLSASDPGNERVNLYLRSPLGWEAVSYLPDQFGPGTFATDGFHASTSSTFGSSQAEISVFDAAASSIRIWQYDGEVWRDLTASDRGSAGLILATYSVGNGLPVFSRTDGHLIIAGNQGGGLAFQERRSMTEENTTESWWTDLGLSWDVLPSEISYSWAGDALFVHYVDAGALKERRYR